MYENSVDLVENKLLLLYTLSEIKLPITNVQLTEIVLENGFIDYFTLQQYITELSSANFIQCTEFNAKKRLIISEKGIKVLNLFRNRISQSIISAIDDYLNKCLHAIKNEITVTAEYTIEGIDNFIVNLKVMENNSILIDLKDNVPSKKQAINICSKWKSNSSEVYNDIIQILLKN